MTKVLVSGASGFVGQHLCRALVQRGHQVTGTFQVEHPPPAPAPEVRWLPWSLGDEPALAEILRQAQPEHVYHLASPAHVPSASADPEGTVTHIIGGAIRTLRVLRTAGTVSRLLYPSSAEVYAPPLRPDALLDEEAPIAPRNIYGICKAAASQWLLSQAPDITIVVRPFNQIGPGQSPLFAVASFAQQIAEVVLAGRAPVLHVGNLDVERDFIDIEDSVEAHVLALERGRPGETYNIASGVGTKLSTLLEAMIAESGRSVRVEIDPGRLRANDVPRIVGSAEKLGRETGWTARSTAGAAAVAALRAFLA